MRRLVLLLILFCIFSTPKSVFAEVVFALDFSNMKDGNAASWLKENGFKYELDADELNFSFRDGRFVLSNPGDINGLLLKEVNIKNVKRMRVEWGVTKFPAGIVWKKGFYRDTLMLVISFGDKKIDSGSIFVPNLPYFIGIYLAESGEKDKAYTGTYYLKGGRYYCMPCEPLKGNTLVTEFELAERYQKLYNEKTIPPVTAIIIESDTRDIKDTAEAFIRKIEFLSD